MNLNELQTKLIAAAKQNPPSERVPYAFEKRIMARIAAQPAANLWALWGQPLWRAAISCVALTLLCGAWSFASVKTSDAENFSQDFESAVFAGMNQHVEDAAQ